MQIFIFFYSNIGAPFYVEGNYMYNLFNPHVKNHQKWLRKIKQAFDPNNIADSGFFILKKGK